LQQHALYESQIAKLKLDITAMESQNREVAARLASATEFIAKQNETVTALAAENAAQKQVAEQLKIHLDAAQRNVSDMQEGIGFKDISIKQLQERAVKAEEALAARVVSVPRGFWQQAKGMVQFSFSGADAGFWGRAKETVRGVLPFGWQ